MPDLAPLIAHWGYAAIFLFVVLGNLGLPVPEETILALSGYLVWRGELRLPLVLAVGILSAIAGDNLGYWIGRQYGRDAVERYGLGEYVERLRRVAGEIEHIVLAAAVIFTLAFLGWRAVHAARERK